MTKAEIAAALKRLADEPMPEWRNPELTGYGPTPTAQEADLIKRFIAQNYDTDGNARAIPEDEIISVICIGGTVPFPETK